MYAAAANKFAEMAKALATDRAQRSRDKRKEDEKRQTTKEQVLSMSPEEIMEAKFRDIAQKIYTDGKAKHGLSPGAALGQNQKPKGKGK